MENVGYAVLQVIPSMRGAAGALESELTGTLGTAGRAAGRAAGDGVAQGIEASRAKVQAAAAKMALARDKEADAAGKVRVEEAKLEDLRARGITTGARHTAAVERLEAAQRAATRSTEAASRAATDHAQAEEQAARATDDAATSTENMGKKSLITTDNLVKLGALGAAAIGGIATALFTAGSLFDDVSDSIRIGTGATGDELSALEQSAKNVGSSVPASLDLIGTTIADVNQRLGLTGPTLETFSSQILQAGNMLGEEIDINGLTASFSAFGVGGDQTIGVMDELFRVSQATGVGLNELAASAVKGAPQLQQFGFSLAESAGLVGTLDKAGLDADKTLGAMNKALVAFAKDGKDPQEALFGVVTEMQNLIDVGNDGAAIDLAAGLFGTKGAGQFVQAVKLGTLSVDDFVSATGASSDTILGAAADTADFAEQWQLFKNKTLILIEPIASKVFGVISQGMGWIADNGIPAMQNFGDVVTGAFSEGGALSGVSSFGSTLLSMGQTALPVVVDAGRTLGDVVTGLGSGVATATGFFQDHQVVLGVVASVITVGLLPALVTLTVGFATTAAGAVTSGVTLTGVWISTQASAVASAGAQVLAQYRIVAGWVTTAGSAVVSGATLVGSYVAAGASATLQAGIATGAWVASSARTVGALAVQGAAFVAQRAVMIGGAAATGIATAAQWAFNLALSANPIGIIILAITALVGGLVYFFTQTETGKKIVTAAWDAILQGWNWMYDKVSGGITLLGDGFGYIGDKAGEAKDWVVGKFDDLVGFVTGLPGRVTDAASGMWDGLSNGFKGVLNWIIGKWNNFSLGFTLPSILGGDRISIDTPDIPYFRDGGKLNGPGGPRSDSMLIRASTGEFINKASSVTPQTLPILEAINDGWVPSADFLHSMVGGFGSLIGRGDYTGNLLGQEEDSPLVDAILRGRALAGFADGGMVTKEALRDFARGVDGKEYDWGGVNWGDCSGAVSALANYATGRDAFGSRFATGNEADELAARGFVQGKGVRGEDLLVGFKNGGPGGGHTAATLPTGENFEMGGAYGGGKFGGTVGGDDAQFTDFWHLPGSAFSGGNPAPSELPAATSEAPASPSVGAGSAPSSSSSSSSSAGASFSPGGGVDSAYESSIDTSASPGSIAGDFVKANVDQAFSDLGIPTQAGGLLKGLLEGAKIVEEHIHYHVADMDEAMSKDRARRREDALAFQATR
ncbi:phage tail tape measure protein [Rhodococcus sp. NPDC079359]|uniref:phage tail tape measure protein n=1 Tax=Rhodococcus sp. NPDC079359 TaxID=3154961 RepID=UPI0034506FCC